MIRKISTISLFISDYDKAKAFYTEKVGFELRTDESFGEGQRWVAVAPKDAETELILYKPDDNWRHYEGVIGKSQAITLQVDDIQTTVAELKSRGVEFAQEPFDTPWGIFATFLDQDKNQLLLVQEK
jgi:lactoylglutathione lyase